MADNANYNKVALADGTILIDLTQDDVTAADVLRGKVFHLPSGASGVGTCDYDADTSDANVTAAEMLAGKTAYKNGSKITGTMPNQGAVTLEIDDVDDELTIPAGYHDGTGKAKLDATEKAKIIPGNIKEGVEILGVTGTCSPASGVTAQTKNVTPKLTGQVVTPDAGYDYLSQVTVAEITIVETDNAAGGKTAVIGAA